ncbi:MAG TPA: ATP-dependent endonuclease, partial [Acidimicrobiia bacterium]|nr:ATP-dependent endonuclease [Acidimicrobiia bacterium]
ATNFGRFLDLLGPKGHNVKLAGMCDQGEETAFRRAIEEGGIGSGLDRASMESLGFFVCVSDLEDELFRALGPDRFVDLIAAQGQLKKFRNFQNQPAHRHKTHHRQLWDWLGTHKLPYAWLMVAALPSNAVPPPLRGVLAQI